MEVLKYIAQNLYLAYLGFNFNFVLDYEINYDDDPFPMVVLEEESLAEDEEDEKKEDEEDVLPPTPAPTPIAEGEDEWFRVEDSEV